MAKDKNEEKLGLVCDYDQVCNFIAGNTRGVDPDLDPDPDPAGSGFNDPPGSGSGSEFKTGSGSGSRGNILY